MDHQHPLTAWREKQRPKVTQGALAQRIGCTRFHISSIETWRRRPSIDLSVRIRSVTDGIVDLPQLYPESMAAAAECAA